MNVEVVRLPPGPVPDVPFVDQLQAQPRFVFGCLCGAQRKYPGPSGRCGCFASKPMQRGYSTP